MHLIPFIKRRASSIELSLRLIAGLIFIYAGAIKAWNPSSFTVDIENYQLLPFPLAVAVSLYLPWLEMVCGLCLATRRFYPGSLCLLLGLMAVFILAISSAWVRGLDISCGCFGGGSHIKYFRHLLGDFAIFVLLVVLLRPELREGS